MSSIRSFQLDKTIFNASLYSKLFTTWFTGLPQDATAPSEESIKRWFGVGVSPEAREAFDNECSLQFLPALKSLSPENLNLPPFTNPQEDRAKYYKDFAAPFEPELTSADHEANANAALALVLLLDQIPRNIFRKDQKLIYSHYDRLSRAVQASARAKGLDSSPKTPWSTSLLRRMWFYMPLMHSESLADHDEFQASMAVFVEMMKGKGDDKAVAFWERSAEFETKHKAIIEKFGRYPYRNEVLGRESTEEEKKWLEEGGENFGTA